MNDVIRPQPLTDRDRIDLLLEEYRSLYSLLLFRLNAMEQRIPFASSTLATLLGGLPLLPIEVRTAALVAIPFALVWLLLTTLNHGRSKEDVLRRVDEIERLINRLAGEDLLVFQSQHRSRTDAVGGRTAMGTNMVILTYCLLMLLGCDYLFREQTTMVDASAVYSGYVGFVATVLIAAVWRFRVYRYQKSTNHRNALFRSHGLPW
ncbi:MAG: hypothetical protein HOP29_11360 [Phycisphaerales bacterium]|nr:hypothetical protein [Phycisphaerales bacterium]